MRNRCLLIVLIALTLGCTSKDKRYVDIDFIAYSWRIPNKGKEWRIYCSYYALIDNTGKCRMIIEKYYPKSQIIYCKINIDKEEINNTLNASKSFENELDLRPKLGTSIFDGPDLKIKINKGNSSKTIHFIDDEIIGAKTYTKLYETIKSSYKKNDYLIINESEFFKEKEE